MRETSNPVFRSLPKTQGGYAQFGTGAAGYGAQAVQAEPYVTQYPDQQQAGVSRPLTIDDVVTKTGITLAVLSVVAVVSYFLVAGNLGAGHAVLPRRCARRPGAGAGRHLRPQAGQPGDRAQLRRARGLVPRRDLVRARQLLRLRRQRRCADRAGVLGTIGVFFGMLVVYKTGAIRVTPKFTRMIVAGMFGVLC